MKVRPAALRAKISDKLDGVHITIPARRNWFVLLFISFWLCGWACAWVTTSEVLFSGRGDLFLVAWMGGWTVGGAWAILSWLWNLNGREELDCGPHELIHRIRAGPFSRTREYDQAEVTNLRYSAETGRRSGSFVGGNLCFDYGAKTHRFGVDVDEAEGNQILAALRRAQ